MSGIYDVERKTIDRAILHHTVTPDNENWQALSGIGRTRTYAGYTNSFHYDPETKEETFIAYHFLVYKDGNYRRCLEDNEIGWHCGSWPVNCRSIAVSFVGDYSNQDPTEAQLRTAADIIRPYDQKVGGNLLILGHSEIVATVCPGKVMNFRDKIVDYVNNPPVEIPAFDYKAGFESCQNDKAQIEGQKNILSQDIAQKNNEIGELKSQNTVLSASLEALKIEAENDKLHATENAQKLLDTVNTLTSEVNELKVASGTLNDKVLAAGEIISSLEDDIKKKQAIYEKTNSENYTLTQQLKKIEEIVEKNTKLEKENEKLKTESWLEKILRLLFKK